MSRWTAVMLFAMIVVMMVVVVVKMMVVVVVVVVVMIGGVVHQAEITIQQHSPAKTTNHHPDTFSPPITLG